MTLNLTFRQTSESIKLKFGERVNALKLSFGQVIQISNAEVFDGPYEVTPTVNRTVLPCDAKIMADDVTVNPIPYAEVSNPYGGLTVSIAS